MSLNCGKASRTARTLSQNTPSLQIKEEEEKTKRLNPKASFEGLGSRFRLLTFDGSGLEFKGFGGGCHCGSLGCEALGSGFGV